MEIAGEFYIPECGCPVRIVSQQDSGVIFENLGSNEKYFPMLARNCSHAFFGVPPGAIRPAPRANNLSLISSSATKPAGGVDSGTAHRPKNQKDSSINAEEGNLGDKSQSAGYGSDVEVQNSTSLIEVPPIS
jgi:hypothetical protein